ncbi:Endodeoxyribonuclease RusA [Lactococcus garvieae]|nr:Endodeoxyribonuclease RusA [Lactococcus garvieae]
MKFSFNLQKMPVTQQQKGIGYRNGKISFYNRKGTENKELVNALKRNAPGKPTVTFWNAIKQKKKWWQFKTTRPDLDNLMKNLQDYMTKLGYYTDDSQIVVLIAKNTT